MERPLRMERTLRTERPLRMERDNPIITSEQGERGNPLKTTVIASEAVRRSVAITSLQRTNHSTA